MAKASSQSIKRKNIVLPKITWENLNDIKMQGTKDKYTEKSIRTIHYYGGKTKFQALFLEIFKYCKESLGCSIFADAFCGSGILSLVAGRAGYSEIYMNDGLDLVVNYHQCIKDDYKFHCFMIYIHGTDSNLYSDRDKYMALLENAADDTQEYQEFQKELEKRIADSKEKYTILADSVEKYMEKGNHRFRGFISVRRAVLYYLYRHYTFYGRSSFAPNRKPAVFNILDLLYTRGFYDNVKEISNKYYKKFIADFLFREEAVVMLDPPYMAETRVDTKAYNRWEFSEKQQRYLLECISQPNIKAKIILCGYSTSFYDRRLHKYNKERGCHWQKVRILKAGVEKRGAREVIWVNFDFTPLEKTFPKWFKIVPETDWDYSYRKNKK